MALFCNKKLKQPNLIEPCDKNTACKRAMDEIAKQEELERIQTEKTKNETRSVIKCIPKITDEIVLIANGLSQLPPYNKGQTGFRGQSGPTFKDFFVGNTVTLKEGVWLQLDGSFSVHYVFSDCNVHIKQTNDFTELADDTGHIVYNVYVTDVLKELNRLLSILKNLKDEEANN